MGYTHYWTLEPVKYGAQEWRHRVELCQMIMAKASADVMLDHAFTDNRRVCFNGVGDLEHDTFVIYREVEFMQEVFDEHKPWTLKMLDGTTMHSNPGDQSCKTARKPYDTVVTACLCVLAEIGLAVRSDGDLADWLAGMALASEVVGRAIEFPIKERESA